MTRYIQFVEENADGCGTDINVIIAVEADLCLTPAYEERLKNAISEIKREWLPEDCGMDAIIEEAMSRVFGDIEYTCVCPDICVCF